MGSKVCYRSTPGFGGARADEMVTIDQVIERGGASSSRCSAGRRQHGFAQIFRKEHRNVLRDVRDYREKLGSNLSTA